MSFLNRVFFALIILSCVFAFLGGRDYWLASKAGAEPDKLTAEQLISRGLNGNPFVEITEFSLGDNLVYEEKAGKWTKVWIPLGPASETGVHTDAVKAVITSGKIKSEDDLGMVAGVSTLRGMVMNQIQSLGGEEKKLLSQSYPGTSGSDVMVIDITKDPVKMKSQGMLFGGLGIAGILVSTVIGFLKLAGKRT